MDSEANNVALPLVVDLDGSLVNTDTLHESILSLLKRNLFYIFLMPFWLLAGRARFKSEIADRVGISADRLPYNKELLDYIKHEKNRGRQVVLATAANEKVAKKVAEHLGVFDHIIASDQNNNLKSEKKLAAVKELVQQDFIYVGNDNADIPVWNACRNAVFAGKNTGLDKKVDSGVKQVGFFYKDNPGIKDFLKALRVHQWSKNLLIFVPLLTSFSFSDYEKLSGSILAFLAFSLAASATYIFNDLWDLDNDRVHIRKCKRPFASGMLSVFEGIFIAAVLLIISLAIAFKISLAFLGMLSLYIVLTSFYSLKLKKYVLIDVLMLSVLYTHRILTGAIVIQEPMTSWLLAFSVFLFFSLALVKRCSELVSLKNMGKISSRGRDYSVSDLDVLWPLGVGASLSSVVVFGLFINAPETQLRYASPQILWLAGIGLIYWVSRLWMKTARGEMNDDPLIFAARDFGSLFTIASMVLCVLASHFIQL